MKMRMPDRLTRCGADIQAHVEPAVAERSKVGLHSTGELEYRDLLLIRKCKEVWLVASWDDQHMPRRHGVRILERYGELRLPRKLARREPLTEGTLHAL